MIIGASADQKQRHETAALKAEFATLSAHQAHVIMGLRSELAEVKERVRWLEEAMTPPTRHQPAALTMPRSFQTVLLALKRAQTPLNHNMLERWLDAGLKRRERVTGTNNIDVVICRLRRRLRALDPPIKINTTRGVGFWMDQESKARLQALYDRELVDQ